MRRRVKNRDILALLAAAARRLEDQAKELHDRTSAPIATTLANSDHPKLVKMMEALLRVPILSASDRKVLIESVRFEKTTETHHRPDEAKEGCLQCGDTWPCPKERAARIIEALT